MIALHIWEGNRSTDPYVGGQLATVLALITTFCLAIAGSLVCPSAHLALKYFACMQHSETYAIGRGRSETVISEPQVDPALNFGCVLTCYGVIALTLVSVFPGALALERTFLAFAYLCVGGLVAEIASARATSQVHSDGVDEAASEPRDRGTRHISLALTMMLNLAFAVVSSGQGLIAIVPPSQAGQSDRESQLDTIIVIGQRRHDPTDESTASL